MVDFCYLDSAYGSLISNDNILNEPINTNIGCFGMNTYVDATQKNSYKDSKRRKVHSNRTTTQRMKDNQFSNNMMDVSIGVDRIPHRDNFTTVAIPQPNDNTFMPYNYYGSSTLLTDNNNVPVLNYTNNVDNVNDDIDDNQNNDGDIKTEVERIGKMLDTVLQRLEKLEKQYKKLDNKTGMNVHDLVLFVIMGIFMLFVLDSIFRIGKLTI